MHGETECLDDTAQVLAPGAQGDFVLSSPREQLLDALSVVAGRGIWAPRAAVALMARQRSTPAPPPDSGDRVLLALLVEGLSKKEIASRLGLAEVTVKAHFTRFTSGMACGRGCSC